MQDITLWYLVKSPFNMTGQNPLQHIQLIIHPRPSQQISFSEWEIFFPNILQDRIKKMAEF